MQKKTAKTWISASQKPLVSGFNKLMLTEFDLLKDHTKFFSTCLEQELNTLESKYEAAKSEASDSEIPDDYHHYLIDEHYRFAESFPRMQWNAQFMMVYAHFEHAMNEICDIYYNRSETPYRFKMMKEIGIQRSKSYLIEVAQVNPAVFEPHWEKMRCLGLVRNSLVHDDGVIPFDLNNPTSISSRIKILDFLQLIRLTEEQADCQISFGVEFLYDALDSMRSQLTDLCQAPFIEAKADVPPSIKQKNIPSFSHAAEELAEDASASSIN